MASAASRPGRTTKVVSGWLGSHSTSIVRRDEIIHREATALVAVAAGCAGVPGSK
jgi:hypothetical protein